MSTLASRLWLSGALFALFLVMGLVPPAGAHPASPDTVAALPSAGSATAPPTSALGVECSQIPALHLDQQTNLRAARIVAACAGQPLPAPPAGGPRTVGGTPHSSPDSYGGTDRDIITGESTVQGQGESMIWAQGNTVVANYNDETDAGSGNVDGLSYSTDGGHDLDAHSPRAVQHRPRHQLR